MNPFQIVKPFELAIFPALVEHESDFFASVRPILESAYDRRKPAAFEKADDAD
jgi:hypothetical protein